MEASAAPRPAAGPDGGRRGRLVSPRLLRLAPDERLVALVRQGSQPAFEALYDRHHRGILAFCRHMLGTREEAEDALQHTFMAAYRALVGSDNEIQLRAWLYAIARNRCLSVLRARREQPADELEDIPTEGLAAEVERRQDLQDLLRDVAELPEDQRAALVLAEVGDLPHDEIAVVIGCPKEKVKALVFQARTSLQSAREARNTSCAEIREMLSTLRGGALRRAPLRRHLRECAGCRQFQSEVKRQRAAMAVLLPVVPSAGLKEQVLSAAFGSQGAAAAAAAAGAGAAATAASTTAGATAAGGAGALAAKVLVVAAVVGSGGAGVAAVTGSGERGAADRPAVERDAGPSVPSASPSGGAPAPAATQGDETTERERRAEREARERSDGKKARKRGQGDRGREFAKGRGKGRKHGLNGTQPGRGAERRQAALERRAERRQAQKVARERARAQRPAKRARPQATPRPRPKPQRTPRPQTTPEPQPQQPQKAPRPRPTPEPTPAPTVEEPAPTPSGDG